MGRVKMALLAIGLLAMTGTAARAQKGKPAPQPAIVNWRCDVVMRDVSGDAIVSDAERTNLVQNAYVDGAGGFVCAMSPMESAQTGNPAPGSATFYFERKPARSVFIPARSAADGSWSGGFDTSLQIRVFNLVDMPVGTEARAMAIPTSLVGAMYADSGGPVQDLVKVVRTNECTWVISFDAHDPAKPDSLELQGEGRVERYTALDRKTLLGTPRLPLGFTLTTRAPYLSDIPSCPAAPAQ